ncbi:putative nuclease HARBI1 [Leguminivora glycinivorella]|uniref:putative nuclease HARBI1 n=1 Tax=Leguminivora glycinivorella TaxID=1035111 RepID=UPI00200C9882|nr:putative nuclease HARBI1 [Leguminivora glycinivorella]XP_047990855.1 putative nuclease HARBI1 [Leguminivora glycinivorella]
MSKREKLSSSRKASETLSRSTFLAITSYLIPKIMAYFLLLNEELRQRKIQRKRLRDAHNPFELPDPEFQHLYRINKDMGRYLIGQLEGTLGETAAHGIPVHVQVLSSVMFMAAGSYQRGVGQDHNLCMGQTTVSKYLGRVVDAINQRLKNRWIVFPGTEAGRQNVSSGFREKFGVPDALGAVDCTHVAIFPPPRPHGVQYINRKGIHTLNVQLVADANCKILNVNAQFPGRVHDTYIFRQSVVRGEMRRLHDQRMGRYFLLGDSGYPLEPWLMTPVLHADPHSPQDRYTRWHCQARNVVERTNGYLKGSLRCLGLDRCLHYAPEKACSLIYACCTLYNIMKYYGVELQQAEIEPVEGQDHDGPIDDAAALMRVANERRENLILNYFS